MTIGINVATAIKDWSYDGKSSKRKRVSSVITSSGNHCHISAFDSQTKPRI
jgi:hypothetical protein